MAGSEYDAEEEEAMNEWTGDHERRSVEVSMRQDWPSMSEAAERVTEFPEREAESVGRRGAEWSRHAMAQLLEVPVVREMRSRYRPAGRFFFQTCSRL